METCQTGFLIQPWYKTYSLPTQKTERLGKNQFAAKSAALLENLGHSWPFSLVSLTQQPARTGSLLSLLKTQKNTHPLQEINWQRNLSTPQNSVPSPPLSETRVSSTYFRTTIYARFLNHPVCYGLAHEKNSLANHFSPSFRPFPSFFEKIDFYRFLLLVFRNATGPNSSPHLCLSITFFSFDF